MWKHTSVIRWQAGSAALAMFCTSSVPHSASPFPVERLEQVFPSIRYWLARWSRRSIESTQIVVRARHVPKPVQLTWANYLCSSANSGGQTRAPDVPKRCFNRWFHQFQVGIELFYRAFAVQCTANGKGLTYEFLWIPRKAVEFLWILMNSW